jgi:metal-sulfur cluster biosynthetic enzyme
MSGAAAVPAATGPEPGAAASVEHLYELLHEVIDPEVGVNIVDLGLVFAVTVVRRRAEVRMTLTTPGCPLGGYLDEAIRHTLTRAPGIEETHLDLVWEPPWGPHLMSDAAKRQLGWIR